MLNNKGFTLVEVLAVVVILGVISMLIVPTAISIIEDTKTQTYDMQIDSIEKAAASYVAEYGSSITALQTVGGTYTVTLQQLIDTGEIESPVKNPKNNTNFDTVTTTVLITKLSTGNYSYVVTAN